MTTDRMRADHDKQIQKANLIRVAQDASQVVTQAIEQRRLKMDEFPGETIIRAVEGNYKHIFTTQSGFWIAFEVADADYDIGPYIRSCTLTPEEALENKIISQTEFDSWKRAQDALESVNRDHRMNKDIMRLIHQHGADEVRKVVYRHAGKP